MVSASEPFWSVVDEPLRFEHEFYCSDHAPSNGITISNDGILDDYAHEAGVDHLECAENGCGARFPSQGVI